MRLKEYLPKLFVPTLILEYLCLDSIFCQSLRRKMTQKYQNGEVHNSISINREVKAQISVKLTTSTIIYSIGKIIFTNV